MEEIIKFENVDKEYKLGNKKQKVKIIDFIFNSKKLNKKKALTNVNFSISRGERVAFIGRNGSGKSTILKLITGVSYPTNGKVIVNGKVNAILELNAGFEADFTGRENIYLKGLLLGLEKKEIKLLEDKIIEFADIGEYIDCPIKQYSSGMKARLGFSIAVHINPEILVVDEALSVGDENFKRKCLNKIIEITQKENITLVLVTHSLDMAQKFCNRGIVINKGELLFDGNINSAIDKYKSLL